VTKLPEFVYLITVDSEWPVSAIADDHSSVPELIEAEIQRRWWSQNVPNRGYVHVWRVPVQDATEMELLPAAVVRPSLREKPQKQKAEIMDLPPRQVIKRHRNATADGPEGPA
jgi:hypothetical protein